MTNRPTGEGEVSICQDRNYTDTVDPVNIRYDLRDMNKVSLVSLMLNRSDGSCWSGKKGLHTLCIVRSQFSSMNAS